ncbi:hypothetical protein AB0T83_08045 [Fluviibacterium sp. DFM31]|uniref:Uncharacterized protein n=1 Tax=Meridianimarinicoccus marinus TaxID=3231483 RepID=A0ABV3L5B5_9RHOB
MTKFAAHMNSSFHMLLKGDNAAKKMAETSSAKSNREVEEDETPNF